MCPIVFRGHPSKFIVTRAKKSAIWLSFQRFRMITPIHLNSWMALKWHTQLQGAREEFSVVFRDRPSNFKVSWDEKSIWIWFERDYKAGRRYQIPQICLVVITDTSLGTQRINAENTFLLMHWCYVTLVFCVIAQSHSINVIVWSLLHSYRLMNYRMVWQWSMYMHSACIYYYQNAWRFAIICLRHTMSWYTRALISIHTHYKTNFQVHLWMHIQISCHCCALYIYAYIYKVDCVYQRFHNECSPVTWPPPCSKGRSHLFHA